MEPDNTKPPKKRGRPVQTLTLNMVYDSVKALCKEDREKVYILAQVLKNRKIHQERTKEPEPKEESAEKFDPTPYL